MNLTEYFNYSLKAYNACNDAVFINHVFNGIILENEIFSQIINTAINNAPKFTPIQKEFCKAFTSAYLKK